ncbi:ATP-dependent DNA helicase MER3 [Cladophialophora chaetospira]|uniref:ATP-dependent DNA helicase MER3 n=1 Tax=Cladophialophora chaetospira TaxID=386627 RepID=A0AA38XJD6_9EURO|nr:ATP-dependent DNA helicase MER3 [Cladophialophora chaetospira]
MEGAQRFLANYQRNSPHAPTRDVRTSYAPQPSHFGSAAFTSHNVPQQQSPYFGQSDIATSPLFEAESFESERPLDDFDRQLLQETQSHHLHPERSAFRRVSLPPKPAATPLMTGNATRFLQDDLHENTMPPPSSSSPYAPVTSPTVSVLQNRQRSRAGLSLQSATSTVTCEDHSNENRGTTQSFTQNTPHIVNKHTKQRPPNAKLPSNISPVVQGIELVPSTALTDQLRSVFKFDIFNAVQSKCFSSAFQSDDNLVVSAPTGSGKTVIMELAICRLVAECKGQDFKVVYQAPTKSLCAERYTDWQKKFSILNLECAELTGDTDFSQLRNVQKASIIITTPEKWDSVTRKWKDHAKLMQLVKLFLVDEVHILKDERGATLEAVVSRMKSVVSNIRFVTLSATVPNSEDIATWLGKNSTTPHLPARREVFGESFRPVQLKKHVYGFEARGNDFAFESMLTQQYVNSFGGTFGMWGLFKTGYLK